MNGLANLNDNLNNTDADNDKNFMVGTVVDNADPLNLGRVKVSIPGVLDPKLGGGVPWVGGHLNSPFGLGPNFGVYGRPAIGAKVRVFFQEGSINHGLKVADHLDTGNVNPKFTGNKYGYQDPAGNTQVVDLDDGGRFTFTSASGTVIEHENGNLNVTVVGNLNINVNGDANITAQTINLN